MCNVRVSSQPFRYQADSQAPKEAVSSRAHREILGFGLQCYSPTTLVPFPPYTPTQTVGWADGRHLASPPCVSDKQAGA